MKRVDPVCGNCKHLKCMGYHYYECIKQNESKSIYDTCNWFEEE